MAKQNSEAATSRGVWTPLNKKLVIVLAVIVVLGIVIVFLSPGLTGNVVTGTVKNSPATVARYIACLATQPGGQEKVDAAKMLKFDSDGDGLYDVVDLCPTVPNRITVIKLGGKCYIYGLTDTDKDGVPSICDAYPRRNDAAAGNDDDGDGCPDSMDDRPLVAGDYKCK